jgi:hypothetical protein
MEVAVMDKNWFVMARVIALLIVSASGAWSACAGNSWSNLDWVGEGSCNTSCLARCGEGTTNVNCVSRYEYPICYCDWVQCSNVCEGDSLICINDGKEWTTIPGGTCNGKGCRVSNCTADDTDWLDSAKSACQSIQGSNDFTLVDTNDVCEHRGHCCSLDSLIDGEGCKWRCESQSATCTTNKGKFEYAVVADTSIDGLDTTYTGLCYNNCFTHPSKDSLTGLVIGNVTAVDNTSMAVGTYYPDGFKGIRSDYAGLYVYDFLSTENYDWADSMLSAPCSVGMYRGVKNGKYVYWKSGQPVPAGVTNVVKVK